MRLDPLFHPARRAVRAAVALAAAGVAAIPPASLAAQDVDLSAALRYRMIGPHRGGRVTAVAGHAARPGTFFFGATGGGVWKTESYGNGWRNVSDGAFATGSIGAIDVADANPDVIWVGTGSAEIRSNVITGKGVYRSDDEGRTWRFAGLAAAGQIRAIDSDPRDPDVAYVAALGNAFAPNPERGIFRTRDGGTTWDRVLFVSDSTGASDVVVHPGNPDEIWAGMWRAERKPWTIISGAREGGVYRSRDGGDSWQKVTAGLPAGLTGKVAIAITRSDPRRLYVMIEAPGDEGGLYRSDDGGDHWRLVNSESGPRSRPFYYTWVFADPQDPDVVYAASQRFYKSADGGRTFTTIATPHGDNHDLWINPNDPRIMIQSNDGGANVTLDGGTTWSTQLNQPTAELYQVAVDDRFPYRVYGAQQDNTTVIVPSLPPWQGGWDHAVRLWTVGPGCETGPIVPHPTDPDIVYGACKGRFSRLDVSTGQEVELSVGARNMYGHDPDDLRYRFQRVSPLIVSRHDPSVLYHASQYVHRTRDGGRTWATISPDLTAREPAAQVISGGPITRDITGEEFYSTLYALAESPHDSRVLWAGANDGPVHVTRDGGATWTDVTPRDLPAGGRVQTIEVSPHDPATAYAAVLRYMFDDWRPRIYRTTDHGTTWTLLTTGANGIPADHPTRVVREDPVRPGLLYAGTEFGMFVSWDHGASWRPLQLNLPTVPVTDLVVHRDDLVLSTMGRSFWILDDVTPLRALPDVDRARPHLFAPRAAYRLRYRAPPAGPDTPEYPPPGATLHYYLPDSAPGMTLEILAADGGIVRTFSAGAGPAARAAPSRGAMPGVGGARAAAGRLRTDAGLHRFTWDLRHAGPWDERSARPGADGPLVVPGAYRVRLTVGGWTATVPLDVRLDPRVAARGVTVEDLVRQRDLALQVVEALSDARRLLAAIESERAGATGGRAEALDRIRRRLENAPGPYPQEMLLSQIEYLYDIVTSADYPPGRDAFERYEELRTELDGHAAAVSR
jgi:photosystem II stability/assembly factor-like uncharacterized protein